MKAGTPTSESQMPQPQAQRVALCDITLKRVLLRATGDLASALGADQISTLTSQTGLSRDELLAGLARQLPDVINQLTPDGRLPTEREASRWI